MGLAEHHDASVASRLLPSSLPSSRLGRWWRFASDAVRLEFRRPR